MFFLFCKNSQKLIIKNQNAIATLENKYFYMREYECIERHRIVIFSSIAYISVPLIGF